MEQVDGHHPDSLLDKFLQRIPMQREGGQRPPIEQWQPERVVDADIRILRTGEWTYQGRTMQREELRRMFLSIMRRESDAFYLVTPVEKARVEVDDAPVLIIDANWQATGDGKLSGLEFLTQFGDTWQAGNDLVLILGHPLYPSDEQFSETLYMPLDRGLFGKIDRPLYYRLAEHIESREEGGLGVSTECGWVPIQVSA